MCGRTACSLDKDGIIRATCQYSKNKEPLKWVQKYEWQNYQSNYNLSPSQISPVLVTDVVISPEEKNSDYIIMPMRWGFIPSWYKGSLEDYTLKTNNCRHESILGKPTFRSAAKAGRRCVVLADGFYEWKIVGKKAKQPYFIHFPQDEGSDVFTQKFNLSENNEIHLPRLLTMAGIFDTWKTPQKEIMYSYSVVTLDSSKKVSFVHSRMPAVLDGKDEVSMWLDSDRVTIEEAISNLKPVENLEMYPVSTLVNFSRNNSVDCVKPLITVEKKPPVFKNTALTAWLQKGISKDSPAKRIKIERTEDN